MNNQEPQSRVKRYDFNKGSKQPNQNPKNFKVWPWVLGLVVVIGILVGGIKYFTADNSSNHQNADQSSSVMSSSSSHNSNQQTSSSSKISSANSSTKSNTSSSKTTKKPANHNDENPNQPNSQSGNQNGQPTNGGSFSNPRQFSSVEDAKSWANATQSSWLREGYNNYTITSDGQGYYVLNFTR
ncbi:hypothetical protein ACYATP_01435 [Lactobacillaceae bacterium Melli_B4]